MTEADFAVAAPAVLRQALQVAVLELGAPTSFSPVLDRPGDPGHGDLTTNAALVLAGILKRSPREIATDLAERLSGSIPGVATVEVAGPGFVNFRLEDRLVWSELACVALHGGWCEGCHTAGSAARGVVGAGYGGAAEDQRQPPKLRQVPVIR